METLKLLEKQSGFLRLISYLHKEGETQITTIIEYTDIPVHQLYSTIEETETREDLILKIEERFNYVISHVASERAKNLLQEMNLI